MNDTVGGQAAIAVMTGIAFILPLFFVFKTISWADKSLHWTTNKVKGTLQNAGNKATNLGKKAAMGSKYGQAAQQFMGQRKQIASMKGREALRGALNSNPNLAKLMGGVGGGQYASRFLNAENRKHEAEQIGELSKVMSKPTADAIARGESLTVAARDKHFEDGTSLNDTDLAGIQRMQDQGYLGPDGRVARGHPHSSIVASAALEKIYEQDDVTTQKVAQLGSLLTGAGADANSEFTKLNSALAAKNKSKDVAYAQFNNGQMTQWVGKNADGVVKSGLDNINKDALKPSNHGVNTDGSSTGRNEILAALQREIYADGSRDLLKVVERTRQTMSQSNQDVLEGLSKSMGFATVEEFKQLRNALNSGGGTEALPPEFRVAMGGAPTPHPTPPTPPTQPPQLIVPHAPSGNGPSNRPRPSNFS